MEEEELFKLKDNVGRRTNGYKMTMNKFKLESVRFLVIRKLSFDEKQNTFKEFFKLSSLSLWFALYDRAVFNSMGFDSVT